MPIKIPNDLPAAELLRNEGVRLIGEEDALQQDIRPMQVGLLNLMPDKLTTETQFARLLGATPLQVELTLISTGSYVPTNVSQSHLQSFYRSWEQVADRKFDGLLITGAPVELMEFEEVKYWDELVQIFEWSRTHVHSTFNVCWGAQAALYHFHRVPIGVFDFRGYCLDPVHQVAFLLPLVPVQPFAQFAFLRAGQAGHVLLRPGTVLDQRERLQH